MITIWRVKTFNVARPGYLEIRHFHQEEAAKRHYQDRISWGLSVILSEMHFGNNGEGIAKQLNESVFDDLTNRAVFSRTNLETIP